MKSALATATCGLKGTVDRSVTPACRVSVLAGNAQLFAGFTFARYRQALAALEPSVIAIGAIVDGRPAGLALGACSKGDEGELLSIAVAPAERRRGIGLALIEAWRAERSLAFEPRDDAIPANSSPNSRSGCTAPAPSR